MHIEARLFEFLTAFFALCAVVYAVAERDVSVRDAGPRAGMASQQ